MYGDVDDDHTQKHKKANRDARILLDSLVALPNTVHMRIITDNGKLIYCAAKSEGLTSSVTDIGMNHGTILQGVWHILGLYDSRPDSMNIDIEDVAKKFDLNNRMILKSATGYGPMLRQVGRPDGAYGITPLLIFRELG